MLANGAGTVTYPIEENFEADPSELPVEHPAVDAYFTEFKDGSYVFNYVSWEDW